MKKAKCRFCSSELNQTFVDLGVSPLANSYVSSGKLQDKENFYLLHAYVCESCFLVQTEEFETPETIFGDYAYFSSYSDSWLKHAYDYTEMMIKRFGLNSQNKVVEIASNDGYLLQYFKENGIPVLGVEPAGNVAEVAKQKGIPTIVDFFGQKLAKELVLQDKKADLLLGNNVLAHVPDLNDFVAGMKLLLNDNGIITMEFPHFLRLLEDTLFDTIYHEHFSYFSFITVNKVFRAHGLTIFDVEEIPTQGGSLRIFACHDGRQNVSGNVARLLKVEDEYGINNMATYKTFEAKVRNVKFELLKTLISLKQKGKTIIGYGAPAKGNTLLNYCGIRTEFLDFTVDRSPHKQGAYLPGTRIPIKSPDVINETKPDYVLILPWNLKDEIIAQMGFIRAWGGKFIIPLPKVVIV